MRSVGSGPPTACSTWRAGGAHAGLPPPYEKNLEDFLRLDLPGSKVVYGVRPLTASLQRRHPAVHWRGVVPRAALPAIYSAADAFVLPSRSETFGLVMLEAMACGTPVAAIRRPGRSTRSARGAKAACWTPTCVPRRSGRCGCRASTRALRFDWSAVCDQFLGHLVPALGGHGLAESALSTAAAARDRSPAGSP